MPRIVRAFDDEGGADQAVHDLDAIDFDLNRVYKINREGRAVTWAPVAINANAAGPDSDYRGVAPGVQNPAGVAPAPIAPAPSVGGTGVGMAGPGGTAIGGPGLLEVNSSDAAYYGKQLDSGCVILAVEADEGQEDRITSILNRNGGHVMTR